MSSEISQLDKCTACRAECCRYIAIPFDTPRKKSDFDEIRWYLLHENTWVYIDNENDWHVEFRTPCVNLSEEHTCLDYKNRPRICRDYPNAGDSCENDVKGSPYKVLFKTREELEDYLLFQKQKRKNKKKKKKNKGKG